jgi:hypothetical protein
VALPIPLLPPVIRATFPAKLNESVFTRSRRQLGNFGFAPRLNYMLKSVFSIDFDFLAIFLNRDRQEPADCGD